MTKTMQPSEQPARHWLPSIGDILFLLVLYLLLGLLPDFVFNDGSTGWHLLTGHYILQHGHVPTTDLVSYTFPDKAWVAYEWLFDAFIAALEKLGGLRLVSVMCCSAISLIFLLLYQDLRKGGFHYFLALVVAILASFVSAIHWLVRPHLVTLFGVYIYARTLASFYKEEISAKKLWLITGITMLIWANSHPAFLMGFAIIFIYWFCDVFVWVILAAGELKTKVWQRVKSLTICGIIALAVSFINPYGIKLHQYILHYLHQTGVISQTDEFASPTFHGALQPTCLELLYFLLAVGLVITRVKPPLPRLMTTLAFAHLSLAGLRSMPQFVVVAVPLIGELWGKGKLSDLWGGDEARLAPWLQWPAKIVQANAQTVNEAEDACTMHILPILAVVLLSLSCMNDGKLFGVELVRSKFSPKTKPIKTLEAIKKYGLDPNHGFNLDNWGGYIAYKTGNRVFIDDRADFFGEAFYYDYADIARAQPNALQLLDKYKIQWILFPGQGLIIYKIKDDPNWKLVDSDAASVLYARKEVLPPDFKSPPLYVPPPEDPPGGAGSKGTSGAGSNATSGAGSNATSGAGANGASGAGSNGASGAGANGASGAGSNGASDAGSNGASGAGANGASGAGSNGASGAGANATSGRMQN